MIVLSGSMTPVIRTGDLIVDDPVTAVRARHLHAGQIASFRLAAGSRTVITHRIVGVVTARGAVRYRTKGDANNGPDSEPRPPADVAGVFRFDVPRGGYVLMALHRGQVLSLLAASLALWFLARLLYRRARHGDQRQEAMP
jgi:signal peptidase